MRQKLKGYAMPLVVLSLFAANAAAVTIAPGSYTGRYSIAGVTGFQTGPASVALAAGTYAIEDGTSIGGSAFNFAVDGSGNVSCATAAAVCSGSTLTFNTVTVTINPQGYVGRYIVSSYNPAFLSGKQNIEIGRAHV